jgi:toxin CptA
MVRAQLHPSRLLAASLLLVHLAAATTVLPLDVSPELKTSLLALVAASFAHTLRLHALLRSRHSIVELEIHDSERAAVRIRMAEWCDAKILGTSCVTPSLTTLNMRVIGSRTARHVMLLPDNVDPEEFRKIRVVLRWSRPKRGSAVDAENEPA